MFRAVRACLVAWLLLASAVVVCAQPIHGHPQKKAYASPAEWPWVSAQCHWSPADNPPGSQPDPLLVNDLRLGLLGTSLLGHTHIETNFPIYSEVTRSFTFAVTLVAFHVKGRIADFGASDRGGAFRGFVVWDDTGTASPPTMIGDPNGVKQWSLKVTIGVDPVFPHGWYNVILDALTQFDNGDSTRAMLLLPVYGASDLSAPDTGELQSLEGNCNGGSGRRPEILNGTTIMRIVGDLIPIAPISQAWPASMNSLGYGTLSSIPVPASLEQRIDMALHAGNPGKSLLKIVGANDIGSPVGAPIVMNPLVYGNGLHTVALIRTQPDGGLEGVTSILLFRVTFDPNAPKVVFPPTKDPPPPPPPPPPPDPVAQWVTVTGTVIQRLGTTNQFRICLSATSCFEFSMR